MTIVSDHVQIFWLRSGREAICKEMMHALYMFLLDDFASLFAKEQQDDDHHCHDK